MEKYTEQQIEQLAPDQNLKNAKSLVKVSKWPELGVSDRALWGLCQGSGKNPYKVAIDGKNLAFKCSCPSRKFPCKHSLALMLMYSTFDSNFKPVADGDEADFVKEWLDKRAERAEKQEQKAVANAAKAADPKAKAKRAAARNRKILDGLDTLDQWLCDVLRNGLAQGLTGKGEIFKSARDLAPRMIDAQAPGLAKRLSRIQELANPYVEHDNSEQAYEVLRELSLTYLISQTYRRMDELTPEWQAEVRRLIGLNESKDEILAAPGIEDEWLILSDIVEAEDKITTHAYVAYGLTSKEFVYLFVFVPKNGMASEVYLVGHTYQGVMHQYPGVGKVRRALLETKDPSVTVKVPSLAEKLKSADEALGDKAQGNDGAKVNADDAAFDSDRSLVSAQSMFEQAEHTTVNSKLQPELCADFAKMLQLKCQNFAVNPFALDVPVFVDQVRFANQGSGKSLQWFVVDASGHALPLRNKEKLTDKQKFFLALTLGHPFTAFIVVGVNDIDLRGIIFEGKYFGE